jgi:hypothetical protein
VLICSSLFRRIYEVEPEGLRKYFQFKNKIILSFGKGGKLGLQLGTDDYMFALLARWF